MKERAEKGRKGQERAGKGAKSSVHPFATTWGRVKRLGWIQQYVWSTAYKEVCLEPYNYCFYTFGKNSIIFVGYGISILIMSLPPQQMSPSTTFYLVSNFFRQENWFIMSKSPRTSLYLLGTMAWVLWSYLNRFPDATFNKSRQEHDYICGRRNEHWCPLMLLFNFIYPFSGRRIGS